MASNPSGSRGLGSAADSPHVPHNTSTDTDDEDGDQHGESCQIYLSSSPPLLHASPASASGVCGGACNEASQGYSQTQAGYSQTQPMVPMYASQEYVDDWVQNHWGSLVPLPPTNDVTETVPRYDIEHSKGEFVLGRSKKSGCDLIITNNWVGRRHLTIRRVEHLPGGLPVVEILSSAQNATYLNGKKLERDRPQQLCAGDVISLVINNEDTNPKTQSQLFAVFEWQAFRLPGVAADGGHDDEGSLSQSQGQFIASQQAHDFALDAGASPGAGAGAGAGDGAGSGSQLPLSQSQLDFEERKKGRFHFDLHYQECEELGCGAFARVKRCVDRRDGQDYAVKVINLVKIGMRSEIPTGRLPTDAGERAKYQRKKEEFKRATQNVLQEIKVLAEMQHPSLIAFHESWFNEANSSFYIAMELAGGPELFERIVGGPNGPAPLQEADARHVATRMLEGIAYLHSKGVVHRDLKPENVLMGAPRGHPGEFDVKIADYGVAKAIPEQGGMRTYCGSPQYIAPEILRHRWRNAPTYTASVDMWSLGVTIYVALCAMPPFNADDVIDFDDSADIFAHCDVWSSLSVAAKRFAQALITVETDENRRMTAAEALQHEWITGTSADVSSGASAHASLRSAPSESGNDHASASPPPSQAAEDRV